MGAVAAPRVGLMTIGCKLNQYETEGISERLEELGMTIVPFESEADAYVVNSCTVTSRSDYRSRQMLRRARRRAPSSLVVATGCYAQRDPRALESMPEVDLVITNEEKSSAAELMAERLRSRGFDVVEPGSLQERGRDFGSFDIERFRGYTRAFIKIQDGCDRRCSYCAVPGARGPSRSRPLDEIVVQTERLVEGGYREVVLTGVHIGDYRGTGSGESLADVIRRLAWIDGLVRIRLGSVEPVELTRGLAEAIVETDKVCRHLHVPLQSGSDTVLGDMGRGYTADQYEDAVRRVTDSVQLCGLGADVLVGFPTETERDFERTVELVERLPFTYLHVFAFSPRPGTPAAELPDIVPTGERKKRSAHLRALGARKSLEFRRGLVGTGLEVLVENRSGRNAPLTGLADNYVRVEASGPSTLANRFVRMVVREADDAGTRGDIVAGSDY